MDREGSGTSDDLMLTQAQIIGIAVGLAVGCLIIILVSVFAFCYYRCCRKKSDARPMYKIKTVLKKRFTRQHLDVEQTPSVYKKDEGENVELSYTYPKPRNHLHKQFQNKDSLEVIREEANSPVYTPINLQSRDKESVYTSRTPRNSGSHSDPEDDGYSEVTYNSSAHERAALSYSDKPGNPDITVEISIEESIQPESPGVSDNPVVTVEIPVEDSIQSYYVNNGLNQC